VKLYFIIQMATKTASFKTSVGSKRQHESDDEDSVESGISSEEEIEETPEEKRLRLASIYLEEIRKKGDFFKTDFVTPI